MHDKKHKYISCLTRMLLNSHNVFMSACPGVPTLHSTHCQFCNYWAENQPEPEDNEDDEISRENLSKQSDNGYFPERRE